MLNPVIGSCSILGDSHCEETLMTDSDLMTTTMRAVRFHEYGKPGDVLHVETVPVPGPGPGRIRVAVHACGLAPADWALCAGLFAGELPRGIGIDVSGTVDAVGDGVTDVSVGDPVLGNADWRGSSSAGASDYAIMDRWTRVPAGLDLTQAAALPMAVDTAYLHLTMLGLDPDKTILIHGAGSTIGYAAVQIALTRGMRVVATAGETHAQRLRDLGAEVTSYGDGMVDRVHAISDGPVDLVLDTAPVGGALPDLIQVAGGDPKRVLTCGGSMSEAVELGARDSFHEVRPEDVDALAEFAQLAADGRFSVPIASTFPLDGWRTALEISQGGHARGKLLLLPGKAETND
jgi:NADPH:quinone reductase-like Zn-dependent oxidoreductase